MARSNSKSKKSTEEAIIQEMKDLSSRNSSLIALASYDDIKKKSLLEEIKKLNKATKQIQTVTSSKTVRKKRSKIADIFLIEIRNELKAYENSGVRVFTVNVDEILKFYFMDYSKCDGPAQI